MDKPFLSYDVIDPLKTTFQRRTLQAEMVVDHMTKKKKMKQWQLLKNAHALLLVTHTKGTHFTSYATLIYKCCLARANIAKEMLQISENRKKHRNQNIIVFGS